MLAEILLVMYTHTCNCYKVMIAKTARHQITQLIALSQKQYVEHTEAVGDDTPIC